MLERAPRTPKEEVAQAAMEGNIIMPQNVLGITVFSAERCLSSEHPHEAISSLVAPIPDDENLTRRTEKANAQHAMHNVGRTLSNEDVRRILIGGHVTTLNFLATTLGEFNPVGYVGNVKKPDETGAWANEKILALAKFIDQKLTPEKIELLRNILSVVTQTLEQPEVKEQLSKRKELYKQLSKMTDQEKYLTQRDINRLSNDIIQTLTQEVYRAGEADGSKEASVISMNIMHALTAYGPKF